MNKTSSLINASFLEGCTGGGVVVFTISADKMSNVGDAFSP